MQVKKSLIKAALQKYKGISDVAKVSIWTFVAAIIQKGSSVILTPFFTRILNSEEYAQYALFQSWEGILQIFITLNVFNYATYTAMVKFEDKQDEFIVSAQSLVTFLSLIGCVIYYFIDLKSPGIMGFPLHITQLMIFELIFLSAYNLWIQKKRYEYRYRVLAVVSITYVIIGPILEYVCVWCIDHMYGRIYGLVIARFFVGLILYIINIKRAKKMFSFRYWKYIVTFCLPLIPHFLSTQILSRIDRIMIDKMCNTSAVAYYSLAYSVSMLMAIVSEAILNSYVPYTYQCIKDGKNENIIKTSKYLILFVAGMNILLILFAPEAIRVFAPEEYLEALYVIPAVSASVFFSFLYNLFANIEYYYGKTNYVAVASIVAAITNILLNYYFIPKLGYWAAGYTTLISYILYAVGHYYFMKKVSRQCAEGIKFYSDKTIFISSVLFTLLVLAIIPLYSLLYVRYGLIIFVSVLIFVYKDKWIGIFEKNKRID